MAHLVVYPARLEEEWSVGLLIVHVRGIPCSPPEGLELIPVRSVAEALERALV